jgi:adenosylcobyric acid synthase
VTENNVETSGRVELKTTFRVGLHQLDTLSGRRLERRKSIDSLAQHLLRGVGEDDLVPTVGKPQRLMSRTATDVDDPPRWQWQMDVELPRGELVPHYSAQQLVMVQERSRQRPVRIRVARHAERVLAHASARTHRAGFGHANEQLRQERIEDDWQRRPVAMSALAIQATSSWAGKSLLTTALARSFARRGVRVAPFKAQNMSNNARVVCGGEIGVAQYLQALAAGVEPDVRMNPVLVKPETDTGSQVVVNGVADLALSRLPWRERPLLLQPAIDGSLLSLLAEFELVLIEGAGSPAEINLQDTDLANMRAAELAGAPVVLVADIDRGGAFAHLYGTWALLGDDERRRVGGFVLNKFQGDPALLPPAPARLEQLTGVPTLGVLPWLEHGLPDEDGAAQRSGPTGRRAPVAVVRYPTASNLDEFRQLEQVARVTWVTDVDGLADADLLVLPGSKHVAQDLAWLRATGLADALAARAGSGDRVIGICGGLQMLGERLEDPFGLDGSAEGLGLLPVETRFAPDKLTRRVDARFARLATPWHALSRTTFGGYEIRHGRTEPTNDAALEAVEGGLGYVRGSVLGLTVHGLFENTEVLTALFGHDADRSLDSAFDDLADAVAEHLDTDRLVELAGVG